MGDSKERGDAAIHELAVTEGILKVVLKHAEENKAKKVVTVDLRVGELRDFTTEWMQRYFNYLSRGTVAEGGKLNVKLSPVIFKCNSCKSDFKADIKEREITCPDCKSAEIELKAGREFFIESIGVI